MLTGLARLRYSGGVVWTLLDDFDAFCFFAIVFATKYLLR